jgi:holo-[acyl-carrier protein] synthase
MTSTIGIDLVRVSRIQESLDKFGERFMRRVFTDGEIAYATAAPAQTAERLAARFAAKEAAIKALDVANTGSWRDIEVQRAASGKCMLALHGGVRQAAGRVAVSLSLSHEGDYATAVVLAMKEEAPQS